MKTTHIRFILSAFLIATFTYCSAQEITEPMRASFHLKEISKLAADQKVEQKEMEDWYDLNLKQFDLKPQWDTQLQTMRNKKHVIEVKINGDGALFFTKIKNGLDVYICRWRDLDPHKHDFMGVLAYYSFGTNTLAVSAIDRYGFVRNKNIKDPDWLTHQDAFVYIFTLPEFWTLLASHGFAI